MINHARTLLLNISSQSYNGDMLGEEYIPPFLPIALPTYLQLAHRLIFGSSPDKVFLNFRAYELLSIIHQTELAEFVTALDPRITYQVGNHKDFFRGRFTTEIKKISGTDDARINLVGDAKADNARGRAFFEYLLRVIGDTETTAVTQIIPIYGDVQSRLLVWNAPPPSNPLPLRTARPVMGLLSPDLGVSEPADVPETQLLFQLSLAQANEDLLSTEQPIPFETESRFLARNIALEANLVLPMSSRMRESLQANEPVAEWFLKVYTKPDSAITTCLPKLDMLGEPFYLSLFGVSDYAEPYTTFKNIWFDHPVPAYRLAAFVLAMIYRIDELRAENG